MGNAAKANEDLVPDDKARAEAVPGYTSDSVPEGAYFAMGDNRDHSLDSRYWGFVPRENIIGKPLIIYWSYDAPTEQFSGISPAHLRDLMFNFFSKTRWTRTFHLIHPYELER